MPQGTVTVRNCTEADMARVTQIYGRSVREETASFEYDPPDLAEMLRRRAALLDAGYPYLVAEVDGQVEGYAYAGAYKTRPAYAGSVENTVYVNPDLQRGGVGRALMERLIQACEASGYRQMIAIIGDSAHVASIEFHKSLGFTYAGNIVSVGYKHGKWLDTVFLQRALGSGDKTPPGEAPGA
ncbi:MAG: GNAT family N-acetyltransferase [Alphaproteobacteria bacterium]